MSAQLSPSERSLVEAGLKGLQGGPFPPEIVNGTLDVDSAYRIQFGILERQLESGRTLVGWKAGNPPPAMQAIVGDVPLIGPLFADGLSDSGSEVSADTPGLVVEVEAGLLLATDLSGPGVTVDDARAAVASVAPCFEIIGGNLPKISVEALRGFIAVGMGNFGVVAGPGSAPSELATEELVSELWIDGAKADALSNDAASPFQVLADLANHLANYGHRVQARERVITGARVVCVECRPGRYEGRISQLGSVNLTVR